MSLRIENHCVDCGLPCLGSSCPYRNVRVFYCDICGSEGAIFRIDGEDYCEECTKNYLKVAFNGLILTEQAEVLGIQMQNTEDVYD